MTAPDTELLSITADIVSAHVGNNTVSIADLPTLIEKVYSALNELGAPVPAAPEAKPEPAVSVRASIKPDYLVCLEDGKKQKALKRHLWTAHQLTPEAYRAKWNLPESYPMVAPGYREKRQALALSIGLGKSPAAPAAPAPEAEPDAAAEAPAGSARVRRTKLKLAL